MQVMVTLKESSRVGGYLESARGMATLGLVIRDRISEQTIFELRCENILKVRHVRV